VNRALAAHAEILAVAKQAVIAACVVVDGIAQTVAQANIVCAGVPVIAIVGCTDTVVRVAGIGMRATVPVVTDRPLGPEVASVTARSAAALATSLVATTEFTRLTARCIFSQYTELFRGAIGE
jgi:hypothetical protein